jgi:hypothetical protein
MYEKLPEQLKKDGRFCLWKYEERNGRMTKVPYQTNGRKASSADKNTFSDFRLAVSAMDGYDGIGMGAFDDFCMVDIDHCVFGGKLTQMAEDVVWKMDSYTEFSPSGTGVRIVCKASSLSYDTGRYYINNQKLGLEIYAAGVTKKFCTLTGNVIRNRGVEERSVELGEILETYMLRPIPKKKNEVQDIPGSYLSDDSVVRLASDSRQGEKFKALWNGEIPEGKSHSDADMSLASILAFWCGGDTEQMDRLFRRSGLMRSKWDRVQSGSTYGALTLEKAVAQALDFYRPYAKSSAESDFDDMLQKLIELNVSDNSRYPWNDNGSGRLFADVYKDIARYVPERKKWYVYDGTRWIPDIGGLKTMELAKSLADSLVRYALTTAKQSPSTGDTSKDADQSSDSQTTEKGKEFYTIQTASEKIFYLVIDRDGEDEKVYFLTEVSENDLLNTTTDNSETLPKNSAALESAIPTKDSALSNNNADTTGDKTQGAESVEDSTEDSTEDTSEPKEDTAKADGSGFTYILIGIAAVAVIGVVYVVKSKKKKENFIDEDEDEDELDEDYDYEDEDEAEQDSDEAFLNGGDDTESEDTGENDSEDNSDNDNDEENGEE